MALAAEQYDVIDEPARLFYLNASMFMIPVQGYHRDVGPSATMTVKAAALVPDDFLDATAMVGDEGWVKERIQAYKAAGVTHLQITPIGDNPLETIEKVKAWSE